MRSLFDLPRAIRSTTHTKGAVAVSIYRAKPFPARIGIVNNIYFLPKSLGKGSSLPPFTHTCLVGLAISTVYAKRITAGFTQRTIGVNGEHGVESFGELLTVFCETNECW